MRATETQVKFAYGERYDIDLQGSRGGEISIVFKDKGEMLEYGDETKAQSVKTVLTATPKFGEDGSIEMSIKEGTRRLDTSPATIYTRETVGFERSLEAANGLKSAFDDNPEREHLMLLDAGYKKIIITVPEEIRTSYNGVLLGEEEDQEDVQKKKGVNREKHELKAYETPSDVFRVMFKAIDHATFRKFVVRKTAEKIQKRLTSDSTLQNKIEDKVGIANLISTISSATLYLIEEAMEMNGSKGMKILENEDSNRREGINLILDYLETNNDEKVYEMLTEISKTYEKGKKSGYMITLGEEKTQERWKKAFGFTPTATPTIPIFDPQAGSGKGILKGMEEANFNGMLKGIELRDMSEAKAQFGKQYDVIDNTNSMLYMDAIKGVFSSGKTSTAADHMLTYLNPPYTNDDEVSKRTVDMMKNGMQVTGLFPEKMKPYLMNSLSSDSLVLNIPRSLTGYTDPKTPERFVFVIGTKYDKNANLNDGLDGMNSKISSTPKTLMLPADATEGMFLKALRIHIEENSMLDNLFFEANRYYAENNDRTEMVSSAIASGIKEQDLLMKNRGKILEAMTSAKENISKKMMPLEIAKKQKIFKDTRFYSKEGVYERLGFIDVAQNIPLLTYYRDNTPAVFKLITEVAHDLEVTLPIDVEAENELYKFGEKPKGEKDKVTNMALGMMKLHYYPSKVDLSTREAKDTMMALLTIVHGDDMTEDMRKSVEAALELSNYLVIKNKRVIRAEISTIMPKEIFVLQDEYGFDCGELGIELDKFYDIIQERNLYDINDYVELAEIATDQKKVLMKAFLDDMQHSISAIAMFNKLDTDDVRTDILDTGKELDLLRRAKKITPSEMHGEIFAFAKKYNLKEMFTELFKTDDAAFEKRINAITQKAFDVDRKKAGRIASNLYTTFSENPISFYEDFQETFFNMLEESLKEDAYDDHGQLAEDMNEYKEQILDVMNPIYQVKVSVAMAYSRLVETLIRRYAIIEKYLGEDRNVSDKGIDKLFDVIFKNMFTSTMGLKEHQFNEAVNYNSISEEARLSLLAWEMRSGKTRAFIAVGYLMALRHDTDLNLILETANIPDISQQMLESFPFLSLRARYFIDEANIGMNPDQIFNTLPTNKVIPKPYMLIKQSKFKGGGRATKELASRMGKDIDMITKKLTEQYGEDGEAMLKDVAKRHKDSPFLKILKSVCPK